MKDNYITAFREPPLSDFDLLFLIDATGSMGGSLNMATKYCIDIWNALKIKMDEIEWFKYFLEIGLSKNP